MKRAENPDIARTMLLLGRLDGRLQGNPNADIFLARARLEGAVALAGIAGVPIAVRDLQDWIAGRRPPPRASEGLNDPVSVAAIFHLAVSRDEDSHDPILRASLNALRTVLDDRAEAERYGRDDLAHFGPMWRQVRDAADMPFERGDLLDIAQRVFAVTAQIQHLPSEGSSIVTVDGRTLTLPPRTRARMWIVATALPRMLHQAGLTMRIIPSLILIPKFLPPSPASLAETLLVALDKAVRHGLRELERIERDVGSVLVLNVTKRSKAPLLARLQLAYPGLQPKAVAQLLAVTPQGARKLLAASTAITPSDGPGRP